MLWADERIAQAQAGQVEGGAQDRAGQDLHLVGTLVMVTSLLWLLLLWMH